MKGCRRFTLNHTVLHRAIGLALLSFGPHAAAIDFTDNTAASGFIATHSANKPSCGQAIADFDRNGTLDAFVTGYVDDNHLFLNNADGTFSESPFNVQLNPPGTNCGPAAAADFDNDGWQDIYMGCDGDNFLLRNNAGNGFVNVTASAGVNQTERTEAVAWADINQDGWLDLFVGTYPPGLNPDINDPLNQDHIFLSNGDGTFTNINQSFDPEPLTRPVLAATFTDLDNDGDLDLYVVNDKLVKNTLWRNDGPGCSGWCFTDVSAMTNTDRRVYGMGIASGDIDLDGDLDLYFSSIAEQVVLRNDLDQGTLVFTEISNSSGMNFDAVGWGTHWIDFDNNQWLDAYLATNGTTFPDDTDRVYENLTDTSFMDISAASGASNDRQSQGVSQWDFNADGLQDLLVCNNSTDYSVYTNSTAGAGNWIAIELDGDTGPVNRNAIGTRVLVTTPDGVEQMREVTSGQSRGGNSSLIQHFGLGAATVADVQFLWPDGEVSGLDGLAVNQTYKFVHPVPDFIVSIGFE